jgi:CRISPR-associated protein Csm1
LRCASGAGDRSGSTEWAEYESLVGGAPTGGVSGLASLFSFLHLRDQPGPANQEIRYYQPGLLDLTKDKVGAGSIIPGGEEPGQEAIRAVAEEFERAWVGIERRGRRAPFESFLELYRALAWAVPAPTMRPGISLYQFSKAIVALAYCAPQAGGDAIAPPPEEVLLVAGDIPGIQTMIYTVASTAAAKGLRGRSAYVQLLGDAVVRRLRREMKLPSSNVVYVGGGNFLMLAPVSQIDLLGDIQRKLDKLLLRQFTGDLSVVLAWQSMPAGALGSVDFGEQVSKVLEKVRAAKMRRFSHLAENTDGYKDLFEPKEHFVEASEFGCCLVCQKPLSDDERNLRNEGDPRGRARCAQCMGFAELAHALGRADHLVISDAGGSTDKGKQGIQQWQRDLAEVSGYVYHLPPTHRDTPEGFVYTINKPAFWEEGADGFWLIANTTPHVNSYDIKAHGQPRRDGDEGEPLRVWEVKDFHLMARQAQGVRRVGVLRMDVDNLGQLLSTGLRRYDSEGRETAPGDAEPALTLPALATLSQLLSLFFDGRLPELCRQVNPKETELLYVIYSGGDDLFAVGAWDRVVDLAARVREDFRLCTGNNPHIGLSGAVTLETEKFPLYRAAERAGNAEEAAKSYRRGDGRTKDAFALLGQVVGWEEFAEVKKWQSDFHNWVQPPGDGKAVPRALLQLLLRIHALHRQTRKEAARRSGAHFDPHRVYYGRWMWLLSYSIARRLEQLRRAGVSDDVLAGVKSLPEKLMGAQMIEKVGLAARWTELLVRKQGGAEYEQ